MKSQSSSYGLWILCCSAFILRSYTGSVFAESATLKPVHTFMVTDGAFSSAELVLGGDGNFYGTTFGGGVYSLGTIFRLGIDGTFTSFLSFNNTNGANPGRLAVGPEGALYGTTANGGDNGFGNVFRITTGGVFAVVASFSTTNGRPSNGLTLGRDGNFYGTTSSGGAFSAGTFFQCKTNGTLSHIVSFPNYPYYFGQPMGKLTLANDGSFYGTGLNGGNKNAGTIFKITTNGVITLVAEFDGTNGGSPFAGVTLTSDGGLYCTTASGGTNNLGAVVKVLTNGSVTLLVSFNGTNGRQPESSLTAGADGNYYGATALGGSSDGGVLFQITPVGTFNPLASFGPGGSGTEPHDSLTVGPDGKLYGTAYSGGDGAGGTVFVVLFSPVITANPFNQNVLVGSNAILSVAVSGMPVLHYQWSFNGASVTSATNNSLLITNAALTNTGDYRVTISNGYGSATSTVAHVVIGVPPQSLQAMKPQNGSLTLQMQGTPGFNYVLQVATNLVAPITWQNVITNAANGSGLWSFSDTNTRAFRGRFFRVTIP